uniref:Uncharacterized protein n=1 Tax=Quercus lobata TaxID=97700 RepID=A0A7N2MST9_QUELO
MWGSTTVVLNKIIAKAVQGAGDPPMTIAPIIKGIQQKLQEFRTVQSLSKQNPQIVDTTSAAQPTNTQSPAHPQPQIGGGPSHPIHLSAPLSSLFSSNPYSNQRRTHIQSNSTVLHLFLYDSAALLLFHSKSAAPPTIFRALAKKSRVGLELERQVWVEDLPGDIIPLCSV